MGLAGAAFGEYGTPVLEEVAGANCGAAKVKVNRPTNRKWASRRVDPFMTLGNRLRGSVLGSERSDKVDW